MKKFFLVVVVCVVADLASLKAQEDLKLSIMYGS